MSRIPLKGAKEPLENLVKLVAELTSQKDYQPVTEMVRSIQADVKALQDVMYAYVTADDRNFTKDMEDLSWCDVVIEWVEADHELYVPDMTEVQKFIEAVQGVSRRFGIRYT